LKNEKEKAKNKQTRRRSTTSNVAKAGEVNEEGGEVAGEAHYLERELHTSACHHVSSHPPKLIWHNHFNQKN
jgi:hypothetical protein